MGSIMGVADVIRVVDTRNEPEALDPSACSSFLARLLGVLSKGSMLGSRFHFGDGEGLFE